MQLWHCIWFAKSPVCRTSQRRPGTSPVPDPGTRGCGASFQLHRGTLGAGAHRLRHWTEFDWSLLFRRCKEPRKNCAVWVHQQLPLSRRPAVLGDLVPIGIGGSLANMASGIETVLLYLIKRRLTIGRQSLNFARQLWSRKTKRSMHLTHFWI